MEQSSFATSYGSQDGACAFGSPEMFQVMSISFLILHFFLPVVLVLFLYGHMFLRLRGAVNTDVNKSSSNRNDVIEKAKKNVFKTMLFITICYAICYVFNSIYLVLIMMVILKNFKW